MSFQQFAPRAALWIGLGMAVGGFAGCGGSTGALSGKITTKSTPLNSGQLMVQAANGEVLSTEIKADGTYQLSGVPVGVAKLAVSVPPPPGPAPDGVSADVGGAKPPPVATPAHYAAFETSGLTVEVKPGGQKHDIPLE